MKVWIAQDSPSYLPVRMQLKLNFGSATLVLKEHKTKTDFIPPSATNSVFGSF